MSGGKTVGQWCNIIPYTPTYVTSQMARVKYTPGMRHRKCKGCTLHRLVGQPVKSVKPKRRRPVWVGQPVKPVKPVQPVQPVEPVEPVEPVKPKRRRPVWVGQPVKLRSNIDVRALNLNPVPATAIALGLKYIENRGFRPGPAGRLFILVCNKSRWDRNTTALGTFQVAETLPPAVALERYPGLKANIDPGAKWCWVLKNVTVFDKPIILPLGGRQGMWNPCDRVALYAVLRRHQDSLT